MSARQLLEQLLQSGQGLARDLTGSGSNTPAQAARGGSAASSLLSGFGGGMLGGGAIGLLLGSKKARKVGGKVAMYGGMAALGALAYKAYGDWQRKQQASGQLPASAPPQSQAAPFQYQQPYHEPRTLDRLPAPEVEQHSNAVLVAMIGAAKADGHIGADERQLLESELTRLSGDASDRAWLETELSRPVDPAAVARAAQSPEMAAEMYLASLLMVDEESFMERAYLDELARQLHLPPELKQQLEAQVRAQLAA